MPSHPEDSNSPKPMRRLRGYETITQESSPDEPRDSHSLRTSETLGSQEANSRSSIPAVVNDQQSIQDSVEGHTQAAKLDSDSGGEVSSEFPRLSELLQVLPLEQSETVTGSLGDCFESETSAKRASSLPDASSTSLGVLDGVLKAFEDSPPLPVPLLDLPPEPELSPKSQQLLEMPLDEPVFPASAANLSRLRVPSISRPQRLSVPQRGGDREKTPRAQWLSPLQDESDCSTPMQGPSERTPIGPLRLPPWSPPRAYGGTSSEKKATP
ncbi:hypothetical protein SCP_0411290 [Sparassis crispa]|uniref:Uncharacterized protein n=1 Tax=Sparassis crispa TaxID=139825 RepID=A0A401GKS8_9APHY|nr:hypothetical protein SCP_0411290 [Sparassis crispa]GBE82744.1 hypothetical protein SCP_0411290 [Sparassis crispa]